MVVSIERRDPIAIVRVNNPPVNSLSAPVRTGLLEAVIELDAIETIDQVILICEGRTFIAGADIKEFGKPSVLPLLPEVILAIENARTTWIAALHGSALGGGLEIALGCSYRVMDKAAKVGLPEVSLGLIPGGGGTVRLPRLIGVEAAVDLISSGKPMKAEKALAVGICDRVVEGYLLEAALGFATEIKDTPRPITLSQRVVALPAEAYWQEKYALLLKQSKGQNSPLAALDSIRQSTQLTFVEALEKEREIFISCRDSDESSALRHMFFSERKARSPAWLSKKLMGKLQKIAVIGGGTMGAGITVALQKAGYDVTLAELNQKSLDRGVNNVRKLYSRSVASGSMTVETQTAYMDSLSRKVGCSSLGEMDLVIEAIVEDLKVKQSIFKSLDATCRADTIFATNTSYLNPNDIGAGISHPERMIGLHFFSPAHVMKLVEVVKTDHTSDHVIATAFGLVKAIKKTPVLAGVCDGFIGNRILKIYRKKAEMLLLEGCSPSDIDGAMRQFGMPMGPFEAQDLGGLDIAFAQRKSMMEQGRSVFAPVADMLCAMKRFGQKSFGGWYDYAVGSRQPIPSAIVEKIIYAERAKLAKSPQEFSAEMIQNRIVFPMINEGFKILDEKIAAYPMDIDLVEVLGFGFPRWRGGLMKYADTVGLPVVQTALVSMGDIPSKLLIKLIKEAS